MRMTFDRLWTWIAIALPALVALLVPLPAVDLAYQVRAGNEIMATGALPGVDTWTFTVYGTPWVDQQWLAQVKLAAGYAIGGWELLAVVRALLVGLLTGLVMATGRARGSSPRTSAILALVAFALAAPALALRPQLYGIVFFAFLLWLIAARDRWPRLLWLAPFVIVVWANMHGSFVLGPAILGYVWLSDVAAGRPARESFAILVAGTLATLVNPYLAGAWTYALNIGVNPVIAGQVSEWQRTSPLEMPGILFYPSVVVTLLLAWRGRQALRWPDWVLLAAVVGMGAWAVRGVAWWGPVLAFILAAALAPSHRPERENASARRPMASVINGVIALALGGLLVVALPWWRPSDPLTGRAGLLSYAPSGLAIVLRQAALPGARVVVPQTWGSWFEWAVPDVQYFVDSRFELYPAEVWADEAAIASGGDAAADALARRQAEILVMPISASNPPPGWVELYRNDEGVLLHRSE